jgi:mannose-1-phosphate guanylyltransferase
MEAIILAGGFGTRLRPLTYTRAKSLLPIMNKPMISYLLDHLPNSVDTVIIAANYKKDQLEDYIHGLDTDKTIIINDEPKPLGTGGAVKFAENYLSEEFFVLNSDIICSLNLSDMINFHHQHKAIATISLWPVENVSEFGVVDITDQGKIINFIEKPKPEDAPSNLINAGAYLLDSSVLDYIETGRLVSMEKEIFPQIIQKTDRFYGYQFKGFWMDIGRIKSYLDIHQYLLKQHQDPIVTGENLINKGLVEESVLGDNVYIGEGSIIRNSVILDGAVIKDEVTIEHSVIGENSTVSSNSRLSWVALGDNEHIPPETMSENTTIWTQEIPKEYPKKQIGNVIGE